MRFLPTILRAGTRYKCQDLCEPLLANQTVKGSLVGNTAYVGSKPQGAEDICPVGRREGRTLLEMHVGRGRPGEHDAGAAQVDGDRS